ncbi:MAG TPA: ice-binding family protein [Opitutaceae bacterium]|jgi:sugar lactone lactonase YvrE|nr:ice-binding family protein [Opitutaceae bacterium]
MTIKNLFPLPLVALAALLCAPAPGFARSVLLTAGNFTILGGTAITSTGVVGTTIKNGNVGLSPGATSGITGFPPAVVTGGAIISTGLVTGQARLDLITAEVSLAGMAANADMSNIDLGGKTLAPGVYKFTGAAGQTGALVLDAQGKNNVFWVFQIATALTTSINSSITVINLGSNGGSDDAIYWNAGSAINIGGNNAIAGNYLAGTSITFGSTTSGSGRALALAGVSLDHTVIDAHGGPAGSDWTGGLAIGPGGIAAPSLLPSPSCIAVDASGNLFVGDSSLNTIEEISPTGVVSLVAGSAGLGGSTDGTGTGALFNQPGGIVINSLGVLFVADTGNSTIRQIAPGGIVTTFAGSVANKSYKDGTGTAAWFNSPVGIAVDGFNNLFVADSKNMVIRKISLTGAVTTFAGAAGVTGSTDSPAQFNTPYGMAVAFSTSTVYVGDSDNNTIRKITSLGITSTPAGTALVTGSADGTGSVARFNLPEGEATDTAGNVYIADTANSTIRKMTPGGTVTTIAGQAGVQGLVDGTGTAALFNQPEALAVDTVGNIYVADTGNGAIREISPVGVVTTPILSPSPTSPPAPAPAPVPAPSSSGGGGAFDDWFLGFLAFAGLLRWKHRKA